MKSKKMELPPTPTYNKPELAIENNRLLSDYGKKLSSGDFTGNLSWLNPTMDINNSALSLAAAQGILQPQFRDTLQNITNQAAAAGSLNSSTFTDAIAKAGSDLNSQYQSIVSQQAINDTNQANANRLSLFGTGLNTLQGTIGNDINMTGNENQFNLANYENQVAQSINNYNNSMKANQWQQVLGVVNPFAGSYFKSQGITNVPEFAGDTAAKTIAPWYTMARGGNLYGDGLSSSPQTYSRTGNSVTPNYYAMNSSNQDVTSLLQNYRFNKEPIWFQP